MMPELAGELGRTVDLWCLGVHPDYRGNRIANFLTKAVLLVLRTSGFRYATIEATNAFTSRAAEWNGFTAVCRMKAKDFLWKGEPLFTNVEPPHGTWTFWAKDLEQK